MVDRDDLLGMLNRVSAAAEALGFLKERELVMHDGAPGRPYRLYERKLKATKGRRMDAPLNGNLTTYLGFTKIDAYNTLHTVAQTLEAVRRNDAD